jgi:hypothetical protein
MEIKNGTSFKVPVKVADLLTGAGVTGIAYGTPIVRIQKQGGSVYTKTLAGSDWTEIDSSYMPGVYDLNLSSGDTDTNGFLKYAVDVSGSNIFVGVMEIVANVASDNYARLGVPSSGSIAADLASIKIDTIKSRKVLEGKWKIDTSTDTFTVYDTDGTTTLMSFAIKDNTGSPSSTQIYERDPL